MWFGDLAVRSVISRCFFMTQGVFLVIKALKVKVEWDVVTKAYTLTVSERYFHIILLHVRSILIIILYAL